MRPGMTRETIDQATREARAESERLRRKPEVEAKAERMHVTAEAIKAEWQRKAAEGDQRARSLLRQCYPEDFEQLDAAAKVLARQVPQHWQEREPGEDEP